MRGTRHPALDQAQLYGIVDLAYVRAVDALDMADNILFGWRSGPAVARQEPRARGNPFLSPANCHASVGRAEFPSSSTTIRTRRRRAMPKGRTLPRHGNLPAKVRSSESPPTAWCRRGARRGRQKRDYIGFRPLFATRTKPDCTAIGIDDIRRLQDEVTITSASVESMRQPSVVAAGARRSSFSGILQADNPQAIARNAGTL